MVFQCVSNPGPCYLVYLPFSPVASTPQSKMTAEAPAITSTLSQQERGMNKERPLRTLPASHTCSHTLGQNFITWPCLAVREAGTFLFQVVFILDSHVLRQAEMFVSKEERRDEYWVMPSSL